MQFANIVSRYPFSAIDVTTTDAYLPLAQAPVVVVVAVVPEPSVGAVLLVSLAIAVLCPVVEPATPQFAYLPQRQTLSRLGQAVATCIHTSYNTISRDLIGCLLNPPPCLQALPSN